MASGETDGWEIKRVGDQEVEVKIVIFLEHSPSKVKLSHTLFTLLGILLYIVFNTDTLHPSYRFFCLIASFFTANFFHFRRCAHRHEASGFDGVVAIY